PPRGRPGAPAAPPPPFPPPPGAPGLLATPPFPSLTAGAAATPPAQPVPAPGAPAVTHVFRYEGSLTIGLTALVPGGASAPASHHIDVNIVATQPDPVDPSKTALAVGAAPDGDVLLVFPGDPETVQVFVSGQ